jgi:hypothetical protein
MTRNTERRVRAPRPYDRGAVKRDARTIIAEEMSA